MALADDRFKVIEEDVILVGLADIHQARVIRAETKNDLQPLLPKDDQEEDTDYN